MPFIGFNERLYDELSNKILFSTLPARLYNTVRPHSFGSVGTSSSSEYRAEIRAVLVAGDF
jgi:hypothetical protein